MNELMVKMNKFFTFFSPKIRIFYTNEIRYNELPVITNKFGQSQMVHYNPSLSLTPLFPFLLYRLIYYSQPINVITLGKVKTLTKL
jgi:hypothetical protein